MMIVFPVIYHAVRNAEEGDHELSLVEQLGKPYLIASVTPSLVFDRGL